jgi:hypothetical protein
MSDDYVTQEEVRAMVDSAARRLLDLSADQFLSALKAGKLDVGNASVDRVAMLARLLG